MAVEEKETRLIVRRSYD